MADPNMTLVLRIQADLRQAEQALAALNQQLGQAGQQGQQAGSRLDSTTAAVERLQTDLRQAEQALAALNQQMGQAGQQGQQAGSRLDSTTTAIDRLASGSAAAAAAIERFSAVAAASSQALAALNQQLGQAGQQGQQASSRLDSTTAAIERVTAAAGASSQTAARLALGVGTIEQTQRKLVELRQQYQLVTSDSTLSAKQRSEAEINYQRSVAATLTQLRALRGGLADNAQAMQRYGLTAGQYQQAMRMLPMQLTDVVTSLATGMPVWMVAIQQGGQIRDMFGGMGNALRAVVSAISPLAIGIAAATAGVGGLAAAYLAGSNEAVKFNEALILTGGHARVTAGDLAEMASQMDEMAGVTTSSAAEALTLVASSGQFAGEQIRMVATAAEQMRVATGKAIEDTVAEFEKLRKDPVNAILELNSKYHFLETAQLQHIRDLIEENKHQSAATEAMKLYASTIADRAPKVSENLGTIERTWRSIKNAAREAVDAALSIGRAGPIVQQIAEVEAELVRNGNLKFRDALDDQRAQELQARLKNLRAELAAEQAASAKAAAGPGSTIVDTEAEKKRFKAQEDFDRIALSNLSKKEKLEKEIENIRKLGLAAGKSQAEIDQQVAAAQQRYSESLAKTRTKAVTDDAATRMLQQLRSQQAALEGQLGSTDKLTEAQRQQAQFVQLIADLKEKKILTAEQKSLLAGEAAIKAQLAQNVALDEQLRKRQALAENVRTNAGLEAELLRAQGKEAEAARIELQTQFAQAMKDLEKTGNARGIELMKAVLPIRQAQIQLDEIGKQLDKTFSRNDRAEQSIGVQLDAGLITETEARQKILDLRRKEADELERQLPILEEIAAKGGTAGEAAQVQIDAIRDKITLARNAATDFERALKDGLTGGIQDALTGLADGTLNLRDAITGLVSSVVDAMAQLAAQQLAEQATAGIMGMLGAQQSTSGLTTGAAAVSASAVELSAAGATLISGAAAVQAAAASLAAANLTGAASQSGGTGASGVSGTSGIAGEISAASSQGAAEMGSSITAASEVGGGTFSSALDSVFTSGADQFGSLFGSLSSLFSGGGGDSIFSSIVGGLGGLFGGSTVAAATGGHITGPGTGTSDSIRSWLSNGEFVTRAAVVTQPGALPFLHAFNAYGMSALQDYARVHHATGGLAGVPAPALPAPSLGTTTLAEPAKAMGGATVQNSQSFSLVLSEDQIASSVWGKAGQQHFLVYLQRNASTVRSYLKV